MTREEFEASLDNLREDQHKALSAYSEVVEEIIKSKEPIAVAMFWVGQADLLNDVPVTWVSNLSKKSLLHYMEHGIKRIKKSLEESPE